MHGVLGFGLSSHCLVWKFPGKETSAYVAVMRSFKYSKELYCTSRVVGLLKSRAKQGANSTLRVLPWVRGTVPTANSSMVVAIVIFCLCLLLVSRESKNGKGNGKNNNYELHRDYYTDPFLHS